MFIFLIFFFFFFSSRRRHTRLQGDWSSDVCSSDLGGPVSRELRAGLRRERHRGSLPRWARGAGSVTDLLSLTPDAARAALAQWLAARAQQGYRLTQILPRLWQRPIGSLEEGTDPPPT